MTSLRWRLFAILLGATGLIWLCAVVWIALVSRSELEHVLDTRLQEAARMVHSLVQSGNVNASSQAPVFADVGYEKQLSCQIWSLDGKLVARSGGAPDESLAKEEEGYADKQVQGELWRVYTIVDRKKGVRVAVGDRIGLRDRLVRDILIGLVGPAILIAPALAILLWLSLGRGFAPLKSITDEIARRDGEDMRPIAPDDAPMEIRPLTVALNDLFAKVETARRHERELTAFAAHELRTPLAGLKTQAQVALATPEGTGRERALRQIVASVDRTSRIVRQLLALAALEAAPHTSTSLATNIGSLLREIVATTATPATIKVEIGDGVDHFLVTGDPDDLKLVLRNLHENAVQYSPSGGKVSWTASSKGDRCLVVMDEGAGIAEDELPRLTERFFRGKNRSAVGSGLGLTIAAMAAGRLGAALSFQNRTDASGLVAELRWRQT